MSCSAFNDPSMTGRLSLRSSATCTGASGLALQDILKCNQPNKSSGVAQVVITYPQVEAATLPQKLGTGNTRWGSSSYYLELLHLVPR